MGSPIAITAPGPGVTLADALNDLSRDGRSPALFREDHRREGLGVAQVFRGRYTRSGATIVADKGSSQYRRLIRSPSQDCPI